MNFETLIRLLALVLGILSATMMAVSGFKITLSGAFMQVLDGVGELAGTIAWPVERIVVVPLVTFLRNQGFVLTLQDHWKYVFVLLWLVNGAYARAFGTLEQHWLYQPFVWVWAGFSALIASVLAGTVSISSDALFWWSLGGLSLFYGPFRLLSPRFRIAEEKTRTEYSGPNAKGAWAETFVGLLLFSCLIFASWQAPPTSLSDAIVLFDETPSPGLSTLALFVTIGALGMLADSLRTRNDQDIREASDRKWQAGLHILSVLGGAATIVNLGHVLA